MRCAISGDHSRALQDVARAISLQPTSRLACKTLPAVVLATPHSQHADQIVAVDYLRDQGIED